MNGKFILTAVQILIVYDLLFLLGKIPNPPMA